MLCLSRFLGIPQPVGGPDEKYIFVILIMNQLFNDIRKRTA